MKIYAEVWGGYSYAVAPRESYPSITALLEYLDSGRYDSYRPCWGDWNTGDYAALIFKSKWQEYPTSVVEVGKLGGLRVVPA